MAVAWELSRPQQADTGVAQAVGKTLLPVLIDDLVKAGMTDLVLAYRNVATNKAASMAIHCDAVSRIFANAAR